MRRFYALLAVVAAAAAVLIWYGSRPRAGAALTPGGGPPVTITAADSAFTGFVLGSDSAPVEVVEYADYQCSHCGEFAVVQFPTIRQQLITTGRVRWRFRDFPLNFPWSRLAASAAQCAGAQGRFWEMADALFQSQAAWGQSSSDPSRRFRDLARQAGADAGAYDACMSAGRYAGRIEASRQEGLARGVSGTPSFFANGREFRPRSISSDAFLALADSVAAARRKR